MEGIGQHLMFVNIMCAWSDIEFLLLEMLMTYKGWEIDWIQF